MKNKEIQVSLGGPRMNRPIGGEKKQRRARWLKLLLFTQVSTLRRLGVSRPKSFLSFLRAATASKITSCSTSLRRIGRLQERREKRENEKIEQQKTKERTAGWPFAEEPPGPLTDGVYTMEVNVLTLLTSLLPNLVTDEKLNN
ncbi:hypothetical protein EYF80_059698 [Liparis tanakae]|uniref:Uncharacterized protein n=1 Tax=Liparis tanakae TaxID=230148 RepID=A0A4Z2ENK1_9TELE|nr:hypothetical protein EYF80_059698 [Liparis tanakae]